MPVPNSPRILALKKNKCRRIIFYSILLSLILFGLFLISINLDPPAPFIVSVILVFSPFLIFFVSMLYYFHVKLFPKYDFENVTEKEKIKLKISPSYIENCKRIRKKKLIKFALIVLFTFLGIYPAFHEEAGIIFSALELISYSLVIILTGSLTYDVRKRRDLEYQKYTF